MTPGASVVANTPALDDMIDLAAHPDLPRPYRAWGYPVVPLLFVLASAVLLVNAIADTPRESLAGLGIVLLGIPAYLWWRRRSAAR